MILLDTCVISEVARDNPDARVSGWFETVQEERLRLSVISVGEIQKGIEMRQPGARQDRANRSCMGGEGLIQPG